MAALCLAMPPVETHTGDLMEWMRGKTNAH